MDNSCSWGMDSAPYWMNGTMVTTFLSALNTPLCFAGHCDWRIPNVRELQSIVDYENVAPAVNAVFHNAAGCPGCPDVTLARCTCTQSFGYWSATTSADNPNSAWNVYFGNGSVGNGGKIHDLHVRAVRGCASIGLRGESQGPVRGLVERPYRAAMHHRFPLAGYRLSIPALVAVLLTLAVLRPISALAAGVVGTATQESCTKGAIDATRAGRRLVTLEGAGNSSKVSGVGQARPTAEQAGRAGESGAAASCGRTSPERDTRRSPLFGSATGAAIVVNTRDGGAGGPDCTLRDAITAANEDKASGGCVAGTRADTIVLEAGATYVLTEVDNETAGPNGLPVIASEIQIDGNGARIERNHEAPAFRLLYIGPMGILTLRGLALANGLTGNDEETGTSFDGGAIYNAGGTVVLEDIRGLSGNATGDVSGGAPGRSSGRGGGIYNSGNLTIRRSLVDANRTGTGDPPSPDHIAPGSAGDGGAIYNVGSMTLESSVISTNQTGHGGGLGSGTVFGYGRSGGSGGGIYNAGSMTVRNSRICSNQAGSGGVEDYGGSGGSGGGICNSEDAVLNLLDSSVDGNRAGAGAYAGYQGGDGGCGGGVANFGGTVVGGSVVLIRTTVSGNAAGSGGHSASITGLGGSGGHGGGICSGGSSSLTIDNSTISGNSAGTGRSNGRGGGIYAASVHVSRSTITNNSAPGASDGGNAGDGGGISSPSISIDDSILAGNTVKGTGADCHGAIANGRFTLIGDPVGCVLPADAVGLLTGEAAHLAPLRDNGGPTLTHALCTGPVVPDGACEARSPAIDAASSEGCFGTDQRGAPRPFGAACDIGAYESGAQPPCMEASVGDCDGSGEVTVNEIITLVNIALGTAQPSACPNGIPNGAEVNVALVIQAVNNALDGCVAVPVSTPTPTAPVQTPTVTPSCAVTVSGQVYDATAGPAQGIAGAQVFVHLDVPRTFSATADADGRYSLLVPEPYGCRVVSLEASADGFTPTLVPVTPAALLAQPTRNFALTRP